MHLRRGGHRKYLAAVEYAADGARARKTTSGLLAVTLIRVGIVLVQPMEITTSDNVACVSATVSVPRQIDAAKRDENAIQMWQCRQRVSDSDALGVGNSGRISRNDVEGRNRMEPGVAALAGAVSCCLTRDLASFLCNVIISQRA